jgi:hypothetical protein
LVRLPYHIQRFNHGFIQRLYDGFIYLNRAGKNLRMTLNRKPLSDFDEKDVDTVRGLINQFKTI